MVRNKFDIPLLVADHYDMTGYDTIHEVEAKGVSPEEWDMVFIHIGPLFHCY